MLKKLLTTFIVLAATATAWAQGWKVTYDKEGARATITTGEQTFEEVIANIKTQAPTVQYVILPDGMKKEEVNSIAKANGFDVAVSKNEATTTETKWVYTYNGEEFIYEGTPTTTDGVSTANVKVLVDLTETKFSYTLNSQPYNGIVFFDPQGNCYGVQNANDVFALTKIKQGYTYNDNGSIKVYTGATRTDANGKIYGNTGEMLPLTTTTTAPWIYKDSNWPNPTCIYEGEYIARTNGNVGGTFYELKKVTATAENPVYTYDNDKKLHIGEVTESGNQYNKTYTATIGNQIITVYLKTSGDYYYYTKDGENHIYRVEWGKIIYTKLDGTGQYACEEGTTVYNVA
ncbi:MAG: hypothetical protein II314_03130, partial [Prevotella sp.]|nr:hypothetical protein [Prevotella sp.]